MKLHFKTRSAARNYARGLKNAKVMNISNKPFNGSFNWAVRIDTNR